MRLVVICFILIYCFGGYAQESNAVDQINLEDRISTIDFVQILNKNNKEAYFYYENNWKVLRERAIRQNYIVSYELLKVDSTPDGPFNLILVTTYANQQQYDKREEHFDFLIKSGNGLKLLNSKEPGTFRKVVFSKDPVKHLN